MSIKHFISVLTIACSISSAHGMPQDNQATKKPATITLWPLINVLHFCDTNPAFTTHLNGVPWVATNETQKMFLEKYWPQRKSLGMFSSAEIASCGSIGTPDPVNAFLKEHHFTIQLDPELSPDSLYAASVLDILLMWENKGSATTITVNNVTYPAVSMKESFSVLEKNGQKVVSVPAKNGDVVYMTTTDQQLHNFELLTQTETLSHQIHQDLYHEIFYDEIIFPMISIDEQPDISWLFGMKKGGYVISQALQQTRFQMNEEGAAAQSAVAIAMKEVSVFLPKTLIINQDFILWIERNNHILFAACCSKEYWKNPERLASEQLKK